MAEVWVKAEHEYRIRITGDWRGDLNPSLTNRDRVAIIYSANTANLIPSIDPHGVSLTRIEIPDGEAGKSVSTLDYVWRRLAEENFTRSDLIVGIGGGTVTDLAGFAAATWLRGIDWLAIPTTLAGMVDASIGGKTGINSPYGKNLLGSFHSPREVLIDLQWLPTLSDRDVAAGLAEVVKCGFIDDVEILDLMSGKTLTAIRNDLSLMNELVLKAISTKARVVSDDFRESELREILNYGHTFGHAIEKASGFTLRHGEAVSIGMVFVAELSASLGVMDPNYIEIHRSILSSIDLPVALGPHLASLHWDLLFRAMALDKKARGSNIRFVAITEPGHCTRLENVNEEQLKAAYGKVLS